MNAKTRMWIWTLLAAGIVLARTAQAGTVTILPIQVCNEALTNCGNQDLELYQEAGQKIWDQAGIDLIFLNWEVATVSAAAPVLDEAVYNTILNFWNPVAPIVGMWFFDSLPYCDGAYGCATLGYGLTFISDLVFAQTRLDTIYHELGHNLGLDHTADKDPKNLMTEGGGVRMAPTSIGDITPGGANLDLLTPAQIALALDSPLVVPEPGTWLFASALVLLPLLRRRRRA